MDPITTVFIAGATLVLKEVTSQAVKDAYIGLKNLLTAKVMTISAPEKASTNTTFQQAVAEEVKLANATEDQIILAGARELAEAIALEPHDSMTEAGIDISQIHAADEVLVKNLNAVGGVTVRGVDARGGSVHIEGISAGRRGQASTDSC